MQFHLENGRQKTEYCEDFQVYTSKQEIADEVEHRELTAKLLNNPWRSYTLDQLKRINTILEEEETK